jgi:GntR family transcriptional repressor for pyruvate dehydrogenase complex
MPPPARAGRVSESIAEDIRNQIAKGSLRPGSRLPAERELAQRLKTSRVSVREAYRSLEETGLITVRRGAEGGAFIADVDHEPVRRSLSLMLHLGRTTHEELTEARLLIEPPVARLAARRASLDDVDELRALVEGQTQQVKGPGKPWNPDLQFHRLIAKCSKNLPMIMMINSLADLLVEVIRPIDIQKAQRTKTLDFHWRLLDAITRRDENAAYDIMRDHVLEVQERLGNSLAQHFRSRDDGQRASSR